MTQQPIVTSCETELDKLIKQGKRELNIYDCCKDLISGKGVFPHMPTFAEEEEFVKILDRVAAQNGLKTAFRWESFPATYALAPPRTPFPPLQNTNGNSEK